MSKVAQEQKPLTVEELSTEIAVFEDGSPMVLGDEHLLNVVRVV